MNLKTIRFNKLIRNSFKARLFEDDEGQFWVPMAMIVEYEEGMITVYSSFVQEYTNGKKKSSLFTEIEEE